MSRYPNPNWGGKNRSKVTDPATPTPVPEPRDERVALEGRIGMALGLFDSGVYVTGGEEASGQFVSYLADLVEREAALAQPQAGAGLDVLLGETVNALEWCDSRYRQTLASKPVLDVDEMRAYVNRTLTAAREALAARSAAGEAPEASE